MFSLLRDRLGIPGLISVIALVFAMSGGAFAAKDYLSASSSATKKNKAGKQGPRGKRGPRGKQGKPGAPGVAGPQGPAGSAGAKGDKGDTGNSGSQGPAGNSVTLGTASAGECPGSNPTGGVTVTVQNTPGSTKKICNGKEGSPWTAGGTLPSGKTLTGTFSFADDYPASTEVQSSISFPIPLTEADAELISAFNVIPGPELEFTNIHVLAPGEDETSNCPGTHLAPAAAPGHLCVYVASGITGFQAKDIVVGDPFFVLTKPNAEPGPAASPGVGQSGALIRGDTTASPGFAQANGSWAVTAQ